MSVRTIIGKNHNSFRDRTGPASPLLAEHRALAASFTDFAGWEMPLKYGSELAEHRAVRETAGLFDLSHMGEVAVTGPEAAAALDFALVGEASKIGVGRAKYSLMCDADGGVIEDLVVYRLGTDAFLVVANAANAPTVARELVRRAAQFDAFVDDQSLATALIAVQGPASEAIVSSLVPHRRTVTNWSRRSGPPSSAVGAAALAVQRPVRRAIEAPTLRASCVARRGVVSAARVLPAPCEVCTLRLASGRPGVDR